jgi:hypothetical protein
MMITGEFLGSAGSDGSSAGVGGSVMSMIWWRGDARICTVR